jgi:hyperosmotically inducible protein
MKRLGGLLAAVAALTISTVACGSATDPSARVARALEQERIQGVDLDWDAQEHFLVLKGDVQNEEQRAQAARLAAQTAGRGAIVVNELTVQGMDDTTADDLDGEIRDRLQTLVEQDPDLREREIDVEVNNGVVTMTGGVRSPEEKTKAEQLARQLTGVRDVANGLDVIG